MKKLTAMKRATILLCLGIFLVVSCAEKEQEPQVPDVSFTPCRQTNLRSGGEVSDNVNVKFIDKGVQITYYKFEVTCDFTTVNVSHTFANGVLSITQQGSPNQAKCVCYTDVSYTIEGISQDEVNVIFINGVQVYCYNDKPQEPCYCIMDTLKGEWSWFKTTGVILPSPFKSVIRIISQNEDETINYEVFVADTLFHTGSFQILEVPDRYPSYYRVISSIRLPHEGALNCLWLFTFLGKEEIYFYDGGMGYWTNFFYHYQKIGKE